MTIIPLSEEIVKAVKVYHDRPKTKVRYYRLQHKWTQAQLGLRLHVSPATIDKYENGFNIPPERKKQLAKIFGCKITDLE